MRQALESGHGHQSQEHVLHDAWILKSASDIGFGDLDLALGLPRVIQQDTIANNVRFSLAEVAPATEGNQWAAIAYTGRHQECEDDPDKESYDTLD